MPTEIDFPYIISVEEIPDFIHGLLRIKSVHSPFGSLHSPVNCVREATSVSLSEVPHFRIVRGPGFISRSYFFSRSIRKTRRYADTLPSRLLIHDTDASRLTRPGAIESSLRMDGVAIPMEMLKYLYPFSVTDEVDRQMAASLLGRHGRFRHVSRIASISA